MVAEATDIHILSRSKGLSLTSVLKYYFKKNLIDSVFFSLHIIYTFNFISFN